MVGRMKELCVVKWLSSLELLNPYYIIDCVFTVRYITFWMGIILLPGYCFFFSLAYNSCTGDTL
jgi:hypothetical protein